MLAPRRRRASGAWRSPPSRLAAPSTTRSLLCAGGFAEALEGRTLLAATAVGGEIPLNNVTAGDQSTPAVAAGTDGSFLVAWEGPDAGGTGVYARMFDPQGAALAGESPANTTTAQFQGRPAAALGGGTAVVVWQSDGQDSFGFGVYGRRFVASGAGAGTPTGAEFQVNTLTLGSQASPAAAADPSGRFVVAWADNNHDGSSWGIFARRFDSAAAPLDATEFPVNTTTAGLQTAASVGADSAGNFVVAWQGFADDVNETRVFARRYGVDGVARGDEFEVTAGPMSGNIVARPSVSVEPGGAFVVTWQGPLAGGGRGVFARRYGADGSALSGPFPVSTFASTADDLHPSAALGPAGQALVTWHDDHGDGTGNDVYGRTLDASGPAGAGEFKVNTTVAGEQSAPVVASSPDGRAVVAWQSVGQDGDGSGVFAQRFVLAADNQPPTTTGIAPVTADEDGPDVVINLFDAFADSTDPDSALTYTVSADTNPSLFRSIAIDPATGQLTLSFAADGSGAADLTVRATDTGGLSAEATFTVTVGAVNDAPVNVVPASQATPANTPLVFAAVHHNRIGVDDVDAGAGPLRVTLTAANGTLTLATTAGVTFTAGDGAGDASMMFTGTPAAVNAAMDGMHFDPAAGFTGAASVTITTDDQGKSGAGGAKSDTDTVGINVTSALPPPSISVAGATVTEPDAGATVDAVFTVTLSEARPYPVTVQYQTQNGAAGVAASATAPADYAAAAGTLTFQPGETTKTVAAAVAGDALDEFDEGFSVVLSNPDGGTIGTSSAAGVIVDNDPPPAVSIGDVRVVEGTAPGPEAVANFIMTLSAPSGEPVSVVARLGGVGDTAGRFSDYNGRSDIITFEPGETTKVVSLPIVGDALDEADETFSVVLGIPTTTPNFTIGDGTGMATIRDDDPPPTVAIGDTTVAEGSAGPGTTTATLTVVLSGPSGQTITVHYATQDDSAAAPADYAAANGILVFQPGEVSKTVQVSVAGDALDEIDESFNVILLAPQNVTFRDSRGIVRIQDDDPPPALSADDAAVDEGTSADGRDVDLTVRLSSPSGLPVSVAYTTVDGSASAGVDYVTASGTLTFAPGEESKTIRLHVVGDAVPEGDETVRLLFSNPQNGTMADTEAVVTIRDDDLPSVSVSDGAATEPASGSTQLLFTVTLTAAGASPVSVHYATADGTAVAGSDYEAASGTLVFQPGELTKTIAVNVLAEAAAEPEETFTLTLSDPSGLVIGDGQAVGTIKDYIAPTPAPRVAEVFVSGSAWSASFKNQLAALGLGSARFGYSVPDGAAQLSCLPWSNVDQVSVRFDADVSVQQDDLVVRGLNVPAYAVSSFAYDPAARTATWTLARPFGRDKVMLDLDGDPPGSVAVAGAGDAGLLDGQWANGADAFPSGDGTSGGDFEFRVNPLPGDVDRSGRVDALDLYQVRQRLFTSTTRPGAGTYRYDVFRDVTADGRINALDLLAVRRDQFQSLPAGEPTGSDGPTGASAAGATQLLFSSAPILA